MAIAANLVAVGALATADGNIVAYPSGSATPAAATINFVKGTNIANSTIIGLCEGSSCTATAHFDLMSRSSTLPAVVDVQGYFYPQEGNVIKVSPSGGDFTSIVEAMDFLQGLIDNSDPDAPAEGNAYIVEVGPGTYDGQVTMVPYVTIRGAGGTCATTITYTGGGSAASSSAAVTTADQAFLESVCITATATGGPAVIGGIYVPPGGGGSSVTQIYDVSVSVDGTGATDAYGVIAGTGSQLDLGLSEVNVAGATAVNDGVTASSGVRASVMTTEITAGDIALGLLGGLPQTAKGNRIDGDVTISGAEPRLINNLITGDISDGDAGTTNCLGNYYSTLADNPPAGC